MLSYAEIVTAFQSEAGDVASLATSDQIVGWFNAGQDRVGYYRMVPNDVAWAAGIDQIALGGAVAIQKLVYPDGVTPQPWEWVNDKLVILEAGGATEAGTARAWVFIEWEDVTVSLASQMTRLADRACVYYALHRFYRKLASNRSLYSRYSTLMGANGSSVDDLLQASEQYEQDFEDTRTELPPPPSAVF